MKLAVGLVVTLFGGLVGGCANGPVDRGVPHCDILEEWREADLVARQHDQLSRIFGNPYGALLDRYDYLDSKCIGINAARGEPYEHHWEPDGE